MSYLLLNSLVYQEGSSLSDLLCDLLGCAASQQQLSVTNHDAHETVA